MKRVAVSIVSHGHGQMVDALVRQLQACPEVGQVILTHNIPESRETVADGMILVIENETPKGFGANHNAAFRQCRMPFYCVLNPDIELPRNPFPSLLACLGERGRIVAPLVVAPGGQAEDSARRFPTVSSLARKALGGDDGRYRIAAGQEPLSVDWVAGMFMLLRADDFAKLSGFDERFFLYYEDVDLCARAWRTGMKVTVCPSAEAIHDARRQSRKNLRHLRWHLASMGRYLWRSWRAGDARRG